MVLVEEQDVKLPCMFVYLDMITYEHSTHAVFLEQLVKSLLTGLTSVIRHIYASRLISLCLAVVVLRLSTSQTSLP